MKGNDAVVASRPRRRIAAVVTEYRHNSHAEMILGRLLGELGYVSGIEVISIYTDQVPPNDLSRPAAARLGIPIYPTIRETIRAEQASGPVDGVLLIGEHGDYPYNDKGQKLYPRRRFLEETVMALDELGLSVPIFSDKHLAYDFQDAIWMYEAVKTRGIPFLGGSSIPHTDAVPAYDPRCLREMSEILVISSGELESYGFHAVDVLQSLAERRAGGETGVRSIRTVPGAGGAVWAAMDRGEWPEDLMLRALTAFPGLPAEHPRVSEPDPDLICIEYRDGTKGYVLQFKRLVETWGYAFRYGSDRPSVLGARCDSDTDRPFAHFERLTRLIETFVRARKPPFPMERTLLSTGMIHFAVESRFRGGERLLTPGLHLVYNGE